MTSAIIERLSAALADRYRLEKELGSGGMATVYLARDLRHGRDVAVKVLHAAVVESTGRRRFLDEIRLAARLNHPHILPLFDSGEASGFLFFVMPVMHGQTLRERLSRDVRLSVDEVLPHFSERYGAKSSQIRRSTVASTGRVSPFCGSFSE